MTSRFLTDHGTKAQALRPTTIVHAARSDLRLKAKKRASRDDEVLRCQHYAFHRKHVAKAGDPAQLIRRAIGDSDVANCCGKPTTLLIYRDTDLLRAALLELSEAAA